MLDLVRQEAVAEVGKREANGQQTEAEQTRSAKVAEHPDLPEQAPRRAIGKAP